MIYPGSDETAICVKAQTSISGSLVSSAVQQLTLGAKVRARRVSLQLGQCGDGHAQEATNSSKGRAQGSRTRTFCSFAVLGFLGLKKGWMEEARKRKCCGGWGLFIF